MQVNKCPVCDGDLLEPANADNDLGFPSCQRCGISFLWKGGESSIEELQEYCIVTRNMPLEGWLSLLANPPTRARFNTMHFPSDAARDEYITTIHYRTQQEVIDLLEQFLVQSGAYPNRDESLLNHLRYAQKSDPPLFEQLLQSPFYLRLVQYYVAGEKNVLPWEGITWVLDLLPDHPDLALQALRAYGTAHLSLFSDALIWGWSDCE
ncbi:MAG TPA: hypothetical protein VMF69_07815, partial [Gemmataceae bacterium]|nr:hypothetical protein [Gemmataceae bacterium]